MSDYYPKPIQYTKFAPDYGTKDLISFNPEYKGNKKSRFNTNINCCYYCSHNLRPAYTTTDMDLKRTKDHVMPTSRGGSRSFIKNKVYACGKCNSLKSDLSLIEFLDKLNHPDTKLLYTDHCLKFAINKVKWLIDTYPELLNLKHRKTTTTL